MKNLNKIGLSGKNAKVYSAILELGRATVIEIAKRTGIKRTSVYDLVLDLINQGYVSEAKKGARRIFIAENPNVLLLTLEQKLADAKEIIPALANIYESAVSKPKLRFYESAMAVKRIMEELLSMKGKEQLFWSSVSDLIDVFSEPYMRKWVKRRIKREIWSRVLLTSKIRVPELYMRSDKNVLREIRRAPQNFVLDGAICIFDNKVAYISSRKESFGFVIESNEFSNAMRLIFLSMWGSADQNKTKSKID